MLFRRTEGWIGADGDYTVALGDDRLAWLFSDTFVGNVQDGRRVGTVMINNSVGVQKIGANEPISYYYGRTPDGKPQSFITPDSGKGHYWIFSATRTTKGLYFFLPRIETLPGGGAFSFKMTGMSLAHVSNPADPPDKWSISQRDFPYTRPYQQESILYGSSTLAVGDYVYIYGIRSSPTTNGGRTSSMVVARVREDQFGEFEAWRFLSGNTWTPDFRKADPLFPGIATEFSVSYVPAIRKYASVYTSFGISGKIVVRLSPTPEGPWSEPVEVFDCPDRNWHKGAFSYAAKGHPELSTAPDELIVTYATNSNQFADLINDSRLYWPRFIRLKFAVAGTGSGGSGSL